MSTPIVWCLPFDDRYVTTGWPMSIDLPTRTFHIHGLKRAFLEIMPLVPLSMANQLTVWRCKHGAPSLQTTDPEELSTRVNDIMENKQADQLWVMDTIAGLNIREDEVLLVHIPGVHQTGQLPQKRTLEEGDIASKRPKFDDSEEFGDTQDKDVAKVRMALAPSSAAAMPSFLQQQQKLPALNGRPGSNSGPPVGLFHPIFNDFQAAMRNPERTYADKETYQLIREFFGATAEIYDKESDRINKIDKYLPTLLGGPIMPISVPGAQCDGLMMESAGAYPAYPMIREVKNEIGMAASDPYNEACYAYRKYWAHSSCDQLRKFSYCPTFLLAIAGPWMCVAGAVYLDKAVIQPLTDYLWLGGNPYDHDRLVFAARLYSALKKSIFSLGEYYKTLGPILSTSPHLAGFPFITECGSKKFRYWDHLDKTHPEKLTYKAILDGVQQEVVVKFVTTYNAQAHHILAEAQLAPTLHFTSADEQKTYGGRYMVVMDFIGGSSESEISETQFTLIKEAIKLLHSHNLVFGDLRRRNILTWDEKVSIIDFDWCGEAGIARYPASLNPVDELGWPQGVEPDSVMLKEHDLCMLEKLQPRHM